MTSFKYLHSLEWKNTYSMAGDDKCYEKKKEKGKH